jgi:hypothetical protein
MVVNVVTLLNGYQTSGMLLFELINILPFLELAWLELWESLMAVMRVLE